MGFAAKMGLGEIQTGTGLEETQGTQTRRPSLYRVLLLNDDYTTMEFVVYVLEEVFHKPSAEAAQIMLHVHRKGIGVAGVYTREIAETKVETVQGLARQNGFPLRCIMERE